MASSYPRGSEWRRWDLHVHSPLSYLNNQYPKLQNGEPDWEPFLAALEGSGVSVVGITDYFSIDGYKKLREFQQQGRLAGIALLPNIEFRLDTVAQTRTSGGRQRLNLHVIFSDAVSSQDIEEHFLRDLSFNYEGNPQGPNYVSKLKRDNLEALGSRLIAEHAGFQDGRSPLTIGASNAVVSQQNISKTLHDMDRFRGRYLIILPEDLFCLIDWDGQDHLVRKVLLQSSDMLFSSNTRSREWCLGRTPYEEGAPHFIREFKSLKACIHGSDAHSIEAIGKPCRKRGDASHHCDPPFADCDMAYCWIKSDPTFEGLKQLLYEPDDRVRIQQDDPSPVKSTLAISGLALSPCRVNDELMIAETHLDLNRDLIAVVGGKGSGKTALVDLIANCYKDRVRAGDKNSFVRRIADDQPDLGISLKFLNGASFHKKALDGMYCDEGEIVYIAQGELEQYVGEGSDLDRHIESLVFASPAVSESVAKYEYETLRAKSEEQNEDLRAANTLIAKIEREAAVAGPSSLDKEMKKKQAELADFTSRIQAKEKRLTKVRRNLAEKQMKTLLGLRERMGLLEERRTLLRRVRGFLRTELGQFNTTIEQINSVQERLQDARRLESLTYQKSELIEELLLDTDTQINDLARQVEKLGLELQAQESEVKEHASLLGKKTECENQIEALRKSIASAEKRSETLVTHLSDRRELLEELFRTQVAMREKYAEVIALFAGKKSEILGDLDFVVSLEFDKESFLSAAERVLDNRRVVVRPPVEGEGSDLADIITVVDRLDVGGADHIPAIANAIDSLAVRLRDRIKQATEYSSYYNAFYSSYVLLKPAVKYKNIPLSKLSLGQKATVLIKIHLAQGTKPIVIDSHDDHLDNEFIMDELVKAVRFAKGIRQVILVSNNGNVVVNSDAEQVILAIREEGVLRYESGSLENPQLRDALLRVLEGGREAFTKRQQKYRLSE